MKKACKTSAEDLARTSPPHPAHHSPLPSPPPPALARTRTTPTPSTPLPSPCPASTPSGHGAPACAHLFTLQPGHPSRMEGSWAPLSRATPPHDHTSTYGMSRAAQNPQGSRRRGPRRGVYKTALTGGEHQDPRGTSSTLNPGLSAQTQPLPKGAPTPSLTSTLRSHPGETELP